MLYFSVDHFTKNELFQYRTLWKLWELVKKLCFSKIWISGSFVKWHESSKLILNQKLSCCIPTHLWWWQPFLNRAISSTSGRLVALSGHSEQITIFDGWLKELRGQWSTKGIFPWNSKKVEMFVHFQGSIQNAFEWQKWKQFGGHLQRIRSILIMYVGY